MQSEIHLLDEKTINKIAAGEVIERPSAVVKELVENAIDAGATVITVEIKDGGTALIRVTDNGSGIGKEQIDRAFLRHATSKIEDADDLERIGSLGFRGEALSSITAVGMVEAVTKTREALTGIRYCINGGVKESVEEIGCPEGTTILVKNLFYNTPARRKFLKSNVTEAGYVGELMERLAQSHPEISFKFVNNGQVRLHTAGNGDLQSVIYSVYGREIARSLVEVSGEWGGFKIQGYIGKPVISRGNRGFENYFINGRFVKNAVISKAIEDGYRSYMMNHRYPFTSLSVTVEQSSVDVNVHPTKMEVRFRDGEQVYRAFYEAVTRALSGRELIVETESREPKKGNGKESKAEIPEPFETTRRKLETAKVPPASSGEKYGVPRMPAEKRQEKQPSPSAEQLEQIRETEIGKVAELAASGLPLKRADTPDPAEPAAGNIKETARYRADSKGQLSLVSETLPEAGRLEAKGNGKTLLTGEAKPEHRIIGQVFATYWLVEYDGRLFYIDQHAAHEKVLYEKALRHYQEKEYASQLLLPPMLLSLSIRQEQALEQQLPFLRQIGFEIEPFGGREYQVRAVPADLYQLDETDLLMEFLDGLDPETGSRQTPEAILSRLATLSCKAAVKGNHTMSVREAEALIDQLMACENPYHCPHGRPVIVSISKYELEKKFKRIV